MYELSARRPQFCDRSFTAFILLWLTGNEPLSQAGVGDGEGVVYKPWKIDDLMVFVFGNE